MEDKIYSIGYEDTDKKIEINIYGLKFEINNSILNEMANIKKEEPTSENIKIRFDKILGENSLERINNKRIEDNYEKLTDEMSLMLLGKVATYYSSKIINNVKQYSINCMNEIKTSINEANKMNSDFRNYTNRYKGKRNYRRY